MMLYDLLRLLSNNLVQHMWNIEALEAKKQDTSQQMRELKEKLEVYRVALECTKLDGELCK